jgi:3-oxoacyl-[acyl-carrier protein] reductase
MMAIENLEMKGKKVVLISGASRGIGAGILSVFEGGDYFLIGTATTESGLAKIRLSLDALNTQGMALKLDLSSPEDIKRFTLTLKEQHITIDILVNNAGLTADNLALRMKAEQWHSVIDTNLTGTFLLSQALLRSMLKKRQGRIINISSVVASIGNLGQCNYSAAKAGIEAMTKSLAKEVASRGITVNSIAPGFIETDMTNDMEEKAKDAMLAGIPVGYMGQPEDIAAAVGFLASQNARYITGHTLHVNGGLYM